ncbi:MAG: hypothetical protein R2828_05085 [Saprospiraceae bacterium]
MSKTTNIFFHYHPDDQSYYEELVKYLPRSVKKIIQIQHAGDPQLVGQDAQQIQQSWLMACQLFIPLASPNYWASDDCYEIHELAKAHPKQIRMIPILLEPHLDSSTEYQDIQVLPSHDKTIIQIPEEQRAAAYTEIVKTILPIIQGLLSNEDKTDLIKLFTESVYALNYRDQREEVYKNYKQFGQHFNPLNILFLRGTAHCGHHLLINILRKEYDIIMETEPEPIPLDMTNLKPEGLWRELKTALLLKDVPYNKPEEIAMHIYNRLTIEPIVLRFDNFGQCDKEAVLTCIRTFWFQLNTQLEKASTKKPPHSLFIFILDKSLTFTYSLDDFKAATAADQHTKVLQLLPLISPLTEGEVNKWVDLLFTMEGRKFRALYDKLCGCTTHIVPQEEINGVYIRQAIEKMTDLLELSAYKDEIIESLKL